ncbi:hypothetical protein MML48_1g01843 [Holotrichia oblita]|uniref:Uncharacterized protein n=1 Tax=Holotrichia oblita TaxID=644536 RepID=A0ACB9TZA9_HOLOL|nr:hypothetical protein MML48_1g01843 [Holotrichia oblita]
MPVILTQTIDILVRTKENIIKTYGEDAREELKGVIGELSKLKYEIQTNKPFRKLIGDNWDVQQYNKYLEHQSVIIEHPNFYNSIWLHSECYMYRRMREAFELTNNLKDMDPFETQKVQSYNSAKILMEQLGNYLLNILEKDGDKKTEFIQLLKLNLWGNKCDLSITNGVVANDMEQSHELEALNTNIICDHSENVWNAISTDTQSEIIDIVLDNAGYELYTDLCLADFVITNKYATKIRFYVKTIPWFISDVLTKDINWTLTQLNASDNPTLRKLSQRWSNYLDSKIWTVEEHDFWTLPVSYTEMISYDVELYRKLSEAKLVVFKGDLNYRKLFGEKNWSPETPVEEALQGFHPSRLCSLRTLKADIICGLKEGLAEMTAAKSEDWLITGNYGVIQYCDKVVIV